MELMELSKLTECIMFMERMQSKWKKNIQIDEMETIKLIFFLSASAKVIFIQVS